MSSTAEIRKTLAELDLEKPDSIGRFYVLALVTGLSLSLSEAEFKYAPSIKGICIKILYGHIPSIFTVVQQHRRDLMLELGILLKKGPRVYRKSALRELAAFGKDK